MDIKNKRAKKIIEDIAQGYAGSESGKLACPISLLGDDSDLRESVLSGLRERLPEAVFVEGSVQGRVYQVALEFFERKYPLVEDDATRRVS